MLVLVWIKKILPCNTFGSMNFSYFFSPLINVYISELHHDNFFSLCFLFVFIVKQRTTLASPLGSSHRLAEQQALLYNFHNIFSFEEFFLMLLIVSNGPIAACGSHCMEHATTLLHWGFIGSNVICAWTEMCHIFKVTLNIQRLDILISFIRSDSLKSL